MSMTQSILLWSLILGMAFAGRSFGDATVYSDRASFEAAIGPSVTYTFETDDGFPAALAPITSFGPIQVNDFNPSGGPAYIRNFPDGTANQTLSGLISPLNPNLTGELYVAFTSPEYAMGFDVYPGGLPTWITVSYGGANPTIVTYTADADLSVDLDSSVFFGLTSADEITSFKVDSMGDSRSQVYKGIDNFTIVPEPDVVNILMPLVALLVQRDRK
ncbi:MAG TPA: hypothetical protein VG722_12465 [Tepidisphaeraceae bacterium]|nr:hypothetical protein [Tepidisphaeraceae bacterium]